MLPAINLRRVPYTGAETSGAETPVPRCPSAETVSAETVAPKCHVPLFARCRPTQHMRSVHCCVLAVAAVYRHFDD